MKMTSVTKLYDKKKNATSSAICNDLNILSMWINVDVDMQQFTRGKPIAFTAEVDFREFFDFRQPCLCPSDGNKYGVSILSAKNSCGIFEQRTQVWDTAYT